MATTKISTGQAQIVVVDPNPEEYALEVCHADLFEAEWRFIRTADDLLRGGPWCNVRRWIVHAELPDMSGIELARQLSSRHPEVPVLVVSDSYCSALETEVLASGVAHYGCKPLSTDWLRQWIGAGPVRRPTWRAELMTSKAGST